MSPQPSGLIKQSPGDHQDSEPWIPTMSEAIETREEDSYSLELRIEKKFDHDMQCRLSVLAHVIAADEWGTDPPYHIQQQLEVWWEEHGDLDKFRDALLKELREDERKTGDDEAERYAVLRSRQLQEEWTNEGPF